MNEPRVRLRDVTLADADQLDAWSADPSPFNDFGGGRDPVDRDALLEGFLARLEPRYEALRSGRFDAGAWSSRQVTTGLAVEVETGSENVRGVARGVDPESGSLRMEIEVTPGADGATVASKVAYQLREALGLSIGVHTVAPGTLPRFEMKASRFIVQSE